MRSEIKRLRRHWLVLLAMSISALNGCATYPDWLASHGPSREQIVEPETPALKLPVLEVTNDLAQRLLEADEHTLFSVALPNQVSQEYLMGPGDVLEVTVWEAPPAALFGSTILTSRSNIATSGVTTFPQQMINSGGTINIPFAGSVPVSGKSPKWIESEIARRLTDKANQPQVLVRVIDNPTSSVTVVGEVMQSLRMPLTAKGERLLDALAASGGVKQPVNKITVQLSRDGMVQSMPLDAIIRDPQQNVMLKPGDVITALYQPLSYIALGASVKNEEINFETQGITLAQALGRIGGLQESKADAKGVFIFRFEDPSLVDSDADHLPLTPDGKAPVVYRADLKDPRTFLVAQKFPIRDKDVLYVANAPAAELQKFLNILTSSIFSASNLISLTN